MLVGAAIFGMLLFGALVAAVWFLRPEPEQPAEATAVLFIIPAPSGTPLASSVLPTATPTIVPAVSGPPIFIGAYVQVSGTGVDGLRIRSDPGLQSQIQFVAIEAEVFQIIDGPREADGYTWWYLQAPYDTGVKGWAVANYLAVIQQNP